MPSAPPVVSGVATSLATESVESGVVEPSASVGESVWELNERRPICRLLHIPLPYTAIFSAIIYRPIDEFFFLKIETYLGFPHDSNYRATKRKVCLEGAFTHRATFFYHYPPVLFFVPTSPNNLEYLLVVSKNLAHPLHPVHDEGKGGGWRWWV